MRGFGGIRFGFPAPRLGKLGAPPEPPGCVTAWGGT